MSLCASHIPAFMHDETPIPVVPPTDCVVCVEEPTVLHVHLTITIPDITRTPGREPRRVVSSTQGRRLRVGAH